jgi:hypothetical protein
MRRACAKACCIGVLALGACDRSPTAPGVNSGLPQAENGRRTSVPGKAMDRAEDLQKEIGAYNQALDDAMSQGTNSAPARKAPATDSPPR